MDYQKGNETLLKLFEAEAFDEAAALKCLNDIEDIDAPILDLSDYSTTYLYKAQENNNVQAVEFLLQHGANPNYLNGDLTLSDALFDLRFLLDDADEELKKRYEIAKLFFKYGADPNIKVDGGSLYDDVVYDVYNFTFSGNSWKYMVLFYKLLVIYGGGSDTGYPRPVFHDKIDFEKIDDYNVQLFECDDGYHIRGYLIDEEEHIIAEL